MQLEYIYNSVGNLQSILIPTESQGGRGGGHVPADIHDLFQQDKCSWSVFRNRRDASCWSVEGCWTAAGHQPESTQSVIYLILFLRLENQKWWWTWRGVKRRTQAALCPPLLFPTTACSETFRGRCVSGELNVSTHFRFVVLQDVQKPLFCNHSTFC